jgi:hypothetical protein
MVEEASKEITQIVKKSKPIEGKEIDKAIEHKLDEIIEKYLKKWED